MPSIDIIIPAYKTHFLQETLECFKDVTDINSSVNVLVFRDGPNVEIDKILSMYNGFTYIKFDSNLGMTDLVSHWLRCINYSTSEYIWLFGDDDIISKEELTKTIDRIRKDVVRADCYRLRVNRINDKSIHIKREDTTIIPDGYVLDGFSCLSAKFKNGIDNIMPNFIFKRKLLVEDISIRNLDLAWMSDDLLWFDMGQLCGITQLDCAVCWRIGTINISGNNALAKRKIVSLTQGSIYLFSQALYALKIKFIIVLIVWYFKQLKTYLI